MSNRHSPPSASDLTGTLPVSKGGTNATTAIAARTSLYVAAKSSFVVGMNADYVTDGTADEVEIQAAIDAANATGGDVLLQPGTFVTAAPINHKSNVQLRGIGIGATIISTSMASQSVAGGVIKIDNRSNLSIQGIEFSVNGGTPAITSYGHTNLTVSGCKFSGTTNTDEGVIAFYGNAGNAVFANSVIEGNLFKYMTSISRCIRLYARWGWTVENTRIFNNHFENTRWPAIYLDDYDFIRGTIVTHNTFKNLVYGGFSYHLWYCDAHGARRSQ